MYPIGQLIFLGDAITVSYHLFTYTGLILMFGLIIICTSIIVKKLDEIKDVINKDKQIRILIYYEQFIVIIKTGKHKEGIYPIQHVNSLHSNLKKWMSRFNGVASKYINNYMKWFKWLKIFETDRDSIKTKNFVVQSNVAYNYTRVQGFKNRKPTLITN